MISESNALADMILLLEPLIDDKSPSFAEYRYEFEKTKEYFPEAWQEAEYLKEEMKTFTGLSPLMLSKKNNKKTENV